MRKFLVLVVLFLAASRAQAQVKTTVSDTIHNNDGSLANGTLKITNPATFTAADGTVVAQNMYVLSTIINGALGVSLIPNAGSNPTGTYYIAQYNLASGAVFTEYWIVPAPPPSTVNLLAVRTLGPPATAFAIPFNQINPPANCLSLGGIPNWTGTQWTCTTPGGTQIQTNGTLNSSQTLLNLQNGAASDGVSVSFSNPSGGNVQAALSGLPALTAAGDTLYWNGSALARFAGNSANSTCFSESSSGVPSWSTCALGGTNTYTANQTASSADAGKLVKMNCSSACTYTLPNPQPSSTFFTTVESVGSTLATVVLGSSMTFNGGSTLPSLGSNTLLVVFADTQTSTNYAGNAGAVPGGASAQIQYNNGGLFGGTSGLTWDTTNSRLLAPNGTASLPAYSFGNFTGQGVFAGSGEVCLSTFSDGGHGICFLTSAATLVEQNLAAGGTISLQANVVPVTSQQTNHNAHPLRPIELGSCAMSAATTCTFTTTGSYNSTPLGFANPQSTIATTANQAICTVSGTTATITAALSNSLTWNCALIGNPD